jgi:hypothetical protein
MLSYEFQSALYRNEREMLDAIASAWVTADGANGAQNVRRIFYGLMSTELADECVRGWGLDQRGEPRSWDEEEGQSHMTATGYSADDLAAAFDRLYDRWYRPVAHLPTDLQDAFIDFAIHGEVPVVETRVVDGVQVTCIFSPEDTRAAIGVSGSGNGDCDWTDAADVDDAFRRYAEDDLCR